MLAEMPADWRRALAVVAHPDDLEYGGSGAIARWTDEGRSVTYVLATRGEAGIDGMAPEEAGPLREREQIASAAVVGVHDVEFLDHPDGVVEYGLPLRKDIAAAIRRHKPELVVMTNHHPTWDGSFLNMADHRHAGLATLDAVRDAANRWVFRELLADGLEPWSGVRWVAVSGSPQPTHAVDITSTMDRAVDSLREHRAYLAALEGPMSEPDGFLREFAAETGRRFGSEFACSFELIPM
ncbi:GlcNAc-PI de-N-acetylase [Prauserella marina]|uniref:N-acetylglucosaminyl deacetylase, LmbE family n=1 Tax=Prauserella marina TaxID=530584 RepID=A0A222VZ39_9PSEU|nr:PIG-L deacetylase family protein [Prauserella marina]ASR39062.1 GlcNAc-PI de-N-acetylase [Prauserella marina]PWV85514.1 LmbE family N-acetylglucosaminyl deacetylase [Prauserella marina]SDC53047.1 N-acetylglucosaminyl deacetylase, LmbE family [Prauserella marina]